MARRMRPSGFTLFEVMAAVLVLGMIYTVLATSAMQGLRSEGLSKRRLEASLLVDELMMELEASIAAGDPPPIGTNESDLDAYQVVMDVQPFDLSQMLGEASLPGVSDSSLLAPPESPEESVLRIVDVAVRWMEAEGEHEVRRTTLVYDTAAVAALFPDGDGAEGAGEGELPDIDPDQLTNPDGTPNVEAMMEFIRKFGGGGTP